MKDKESGLPKKYVSGLSKSTAKARAAHWKKMAKYSDRDPRAYEPAPGDKTAKTKLSKYTKKYREMFGEEVDEACWTGYTQKGMKKKGNKMVPNCVPVSEEAAAGLAAKAKKSGISLSTLKTVYRRGVAAWNSGHRPGTTPQQWGHARVNSYITKGKTYHTADKDLREEHGAGDEGTKKLVKKYLKDTPHAKIVNVKEQVRKKYLGNLKGKTETGKRANQINMEPSIELGREHAGTNLGTK